MIPLHQIQHLYCQMDSLGLRRKMFLKPVSRKTGYESNFNSNPQQLSIHPTLNITIDGKSNLFVYNGIMIIQSNQTNKKTDNKGQIDILNLKKYQSRSKTLNQTETERKNTLNQVFSQNITLYGVKQEAFDEEKEVLINQFESIYAKNNTNQKSNTKMDKSHIKEQIQKILGKQQSQTIQKTLQKMISKQILKDETKIVIASQILTDCLSLIKQYHRDDLQKVYGNPFIAINSINKSILQYIKSKYPRNKAISAPMGLDRKFEKINYLNYYQYDTLVNAKFSFTSSSDGRIQTLDKAKKFINCILKQVDTHFQSFNNLLCNKIFKLKDNDKIEQQTHQKAIHYKFTSQKSGQSKSQDLYKIHHVKISRKIPQNSQKYYQFGTDRMEIPSPQLFRVMLKWIDGMQQLINNPSNLIKDRVGLKYIKKHHGIAHQQNIIFDQIQSRRFEDLKIDIIQKISEIKQREYDIKIKELLKKLNQFNNNLVKTLTVRSPKLKFIQQQLAETLKFSKFNSLFLEWLIIQKFLIIIQTLSQLSAQFEQKIYKNLDFINFDVFDLMRACYSGKKQQIVQIFQNLKTFEAEGELSIIRIKNRLQTPLNDVLINFKMHNSFIICELQLILADARQQGEQKLKHIQDLNHIIYQLERSPYGSMSQMAMIISHYDPTINYEAKINFNNDWYTDQICKYSDGNNQQHSFIEIKTQTTPFVCSWCVKFYGRLDNFFEYHKCAKCNLEKCKACVFETNPTQQKRTYYKHFAMCFLGLSNGLEDFSELKDQNFVDNFFMRQESNFFSENYVKVRDYVNIEKGVKICQLQKLLHQYQKQYGLKATQAFYCLLLRFYNGSSELIALKYQNYKVQICSEINQQQQNGNYATKLQRKQTIIKLSKHDALFFLKKKVYINQRQSDGSYIDKCWLNESKKVAFLTNSQQKVHVQNKKKYKITCLVHKKERYLLQIVKQQIKQTKGSQQQSKQIPSQHQQIARVIQKTVSKCISYKIQRLNFQLPNLGLMEKNLEQFFQSSAKQQTNKLRNQWTKQTSVLNLSENKIQNPTNLIKIFCSLKQLYLANNLVSNIQFLKYTNNLKVLDLQLNKIKEISSSINEKNMINLTVLKLSQNNIDKYVKFNLPYLQQLYLNANRIQSFENLFDSNMPAIYIMDISKNSMMGNTILDWKNFSKFPKLKKLEAKKINLEIDENSNNKHFFTLEWLCKLQFLDISHNKLSVLNSLSQRKLRQLKLIFCNIKSINNTFTNKLINLQVLQLQSNQISQFPQNLELSQLKIFKLSNNRIKNLSNISKCYLPKLQILQLQSNGIKDVSQLEYTSFNSLKQLSLDHNMIQTIPILNWPVLEVLNLDYNKLKDVDSLSKSNLPKLKFLLIKSNNLKSLPCLNFPELLELSPINNQLTSLEEFAKSNLPKINKLAIFRNKLKQICDKFIFPNVTALILFDNHLTNIDGLSISKFDSLKMLSVNSNKILNLPKLNLNYLQILNASQNRLVSIDIINQWNTPKLRVVDVRSNSIQHLSALKQLSIQVLDINSNDLSDLTDFSSNSKLPMLRKFTANFNKKLKKIGGDFRGCPRLQQIVINNCSLEHFDELSSVGNLAQKNQNLKYLKRLSLQNNQITHLPQAGSLNRLENLQQLLVRSNKITQFDYKISELKSLKVLYLSSNQITQIHSQYFEDDCRLGQISLTRNSLKQLSLPETLQLNSLTLNFCQLTDKMLQNLQLPKLKQLFLKKNELQTLNFLTVPGAFSSLKKLYLQQNKIKNFPKFNLPEITEIFLLQNPLIDVSQLLTCTIPMIKFLYLRKIKRQNKNRNRNSKKQNIINKDQKKQEVNDGIDSENIFRQILQIQNKQLKNSKMIQSSSQQQTENINKDKEEQQIQLKMQSKKSKQNSEIQQQIMKVITQFKKLNPNVYIKY